MKTYRLNFADMMKSVLLAVVTLALCILRCVIGDKIKAGKASG